MDVSEYHPGAVPASPGVYVFRDRFGSVIYVGKARNLRRRLGNYFQPSRKHAADPKLRSLINSIADWSFETVRSEDEALILESRLIKSYAPYYNVLMRDDKRYLLLKLDRSERFPTLKAARIRKPDNAEYFGPFPKGTALRGTLEFLLARFGLRACRDPEPDEETRKRCLKRIVRDCCGPCTGQVTDEEYGRRLEQALAVLKGDIKPLVAELEEKMQAAAAAEKFEKAARCRDVMENLEAVFGRRSRAFIHPELPGGAPGTTATAALGRALGLERVPEVVICFDISNILGTIAVASMVVFRNGRPERSGYRRFRIRTVHQSDDFAMMAEAVGRHFQRLLEEKRPMPDLLVVDGGKGQLSSAVEKLIELGTPPLPVIGLAKRNEEIFIPGRSEPLVLDRHDPALKLLQALRDEAHRFAITYHRSLRNKLIENSLLDDLPGVGRVRKLQLLRAFPSVRDIAAATPEEIAARVPGIGTNTAQKIITALSASLAGGAGGWND